jgi:hypothetical protein
MKITAAMTPILFIKTIHSNNMITYTVKVDEYLMVFAIDIPPEWANGSKWWYDHHRRNHLQIV